MPKNKYKCGIYIIKNTINDKFYIGQSIDCYRRFYMHKYYFKKRKGINVHLQNAVDKYGIDNFEFKILLYCDPENLTLYEQLLVNNLKPEYNCRVECVDSPDKRYLKIMMRERHRNKRLLRFYDSSEFYGFMKDPSKSLQHYYFLFLSRNDLRDKNRYLKF